MLKLKVDYFKAEVVLPKGIATLLPRSILDPPLLHPHTPDTLIVAARGKHVLLRVHSQRPQLALGVALHQALRFAAVGHGDLKHFSVLRPSQDAVRAPVDTPHHQTCTRHDLFEPQPLNNMQTKAHATFSLE